MPAPNSTSYPTAAIAQAYGVPVDLAQRFGWGIIVNHRQFKVHVKLMGKPVPLPIPEPDYWIDDAAKRVLALLGPGRSTLFHHELHAAYRQTGVI